MEKMKNIQRVNLVCVGSELFFYVVNTNIHNANKILEENGFELNCNVIVPDDMGKIIDSVIFCINTGDAVIISGGLGPTFDDITRESMAKMLNKNLIFSQQAWNQIQERFKARKIDSIPEKNKRQAMVIEGAVMFPNEIGTAPGMFFEYMGKPVFLLPGPPVEFENMMRKCVIPELIRQRGSEIQNVFVRKGFGIAGEPESIVEEKTEKLRKDIELTGGVWTILALPYLIELWLKLPVDKKNLFEDVENELRNIFQDSFLGTDGITIPQALALLLNKRKLVCCFAESCTGGLAGHLMTEIPGISSCFNGSIVTYSNKLKKKLLKVPKTILRKYGAVSEQTAIAMAKGARKYGKADVSLAITGIAGPSGGTIEKPVGLVWMAVALTNKNVQTKKFYFSGTRSTIKTRAALAGIDLLRRVLLREQK